MGILEKFKSKKEQELKGDIVEDTKVVKETAETDGAKKKPAAKKTAKVIPSDLSGVVLRPLVTEKAAIVAHGGQYTFVVATKSNRVQVKSAIRAMYGILPESVNIQNMRGKVVRFGRSNGQRASWKKAIVTLPKGKTIDIYEGV
ncbi:MAG: 50S ribosomal protein L23 [Candidatus Uhrbacteria bacterium]